MKRSFKTHLSLALAAALALSLTACGPKNPAQSGSSASGSASASQSQENPSGSVSTPDKPDASVTAPTNEGLEQLRKELEPSGAIAGIFFLGTHEGEPLDKEFYSEEDRAAYFREYPFLKEIPAERYARTEGWQVFCVVPADPKASVVVKEWDESGDKPVEGKTLYESNTGEPLFLQGNISDLMPNLSITIVDSYGNVLDKYHPFVSAMDGSLILPGNDQPLVLEQKLPDEDGEGFDLYLPDEANNNWVTERIHNDVEDPTFVLSLLKENRVVPDDVELLDFRVEGKALHMSMNSAFDECLHDEIHEVEKFLGCLVGSYLSAYDADEIFLYINGIVMNDGHSFGHDMVEYDY